MKIKIDKSFEKDTDKISNTKLLLKIADIIEGVQNCNTLSDIKNLKKLKAGINCFRIKIGDYRIGFQFIEDCIIFERCLHRKDIYKYFP